MQLSPLSFVYLLSLQFHNRLMRTHATCPCMCHGHTCVRHRRGGQLRCDSVSKSHCCRPTAIPCQRAFQPPFEWLRRQKLQGVFLFVFVGGGEFCEGCGCTSTGQ